MRLLCLLGGIVLGVLGAMVAGWWWLLHDAVRNEGR